MGTVAFLCCAQGTQGPAESTHLLFEVAPLLLVYQHQVEVIAHRELLIYVSHGGCELIPCQEEPDGDGLTCKGRGKDEGKGHERHHPTAPALAAAGQTPAEQGKGHGTKASAL